MSPQKLDYGVYIVQEGQNPVDIAQEVYNDAKRVKWLLEANPDAEWEPGERVLVPNKKGTLLTARENDGLSTLFQRELPGKSLEQYVALIFKWNGGYGLKIAEGDEIFVPDRQSYGY